MDNKSINAIVESSKQTLIDLTRQLVDIETENNPPNGNELEGQIAFASICKDLGLDIDAFSPDEIPGFSHNEAFLQGQSYENRKNVVACWRGNGTGKSIVMSGHMDVAPKEPLPWKLCPPYASIVKDGRLYGRGACDMKGGLACAIMAVRLLKENGFIPAGDILLESVVDEEFASGNGTIASRLRGHNADFGIDLEPSALRICPATVGGLVVKITIQGTAGMPYTGDEIYNPAYGIADMINLIRQYEKIRQGSVLKHPLWKDAMQQCLMPILKVKAGEVKAHGQLSVPIDAWLELTIQTYPGESEEFVMGEFKKFILEHFDSSVDVMIEREYHYIEPGDCDPSCEAVKLLKNCADRYYNEPAIICGAPFSCDLFAFHKYGHMNAVVYGPVGGNLHAPDEWVDIGSMLTATKVLMDFIVNWCIDEESALIK